MLIENEVKMALYTIGIDFGSLSARAKLVDIKEDKTKLFQMVLII